MSGPGGCSGPAPSKRLTDHVNRDNSLHQDRLVNQAGQSAGFRSQGPARDQQTGDQFEAFMNQGPHLADHQAPLLGRETQGHPMTMAARDQGFQPNQGMPMPGASNHQVPFQARPAVTAAPAGNNWAAQFAAMNAAQQVPIPPAGQPAMTQRNPFHQPPAPPPAFNVHEFRRSFAHPPPQAVQNGTSNAVFAPIYDPANANVDPQQAAITRDQANDEFSREMDAWMSSNGPNGYNAQDLANVDAELAAVAQEFGQQVEEDPVAVMTEIADQADADRQAEELAARITEQLTVEDARSDMALTDLGRTELGSLAQPPNEGRAADSEIAAAAGRVVDQMQHETDPKWVQSVFMQLMRDLFEGNKVVEDNTVKDANKRDDDDSAV